MRILVVDDVYEAGSQYIFKANLAGIGAIRSGNVGTHQHEVDEKLASEGFELVFVTDGIAGLECYRNHGPFDLVITDFVHPGMDGFELAKTIRSENPNQAIAMVTGGLAEGIEEELRRSKIPVFSRAGDSGWYRKIVATAIELNQLRIGR